MPGNGLGDGVFGGFLDNESGKHGNITLASMTRPSGSLCGLAQISPVKGKQWRQLMQLPTIADRVAALKDPATRALLVAEGREKGMWYDPDHIYPLGTGPSPDYAEEGGVSIAQLAAQAGVADRVRFLGRVEDMPALFAAADIFVHPTLHDACSLAARCIS